jgi:hypothetical protein
MEGPEEAGVRSSLFSLVGPESRVSKHHLTLITSPTQCQWWCYRATDIYVYNAIKILTVSASQEITHEIDLLRLMKKKFVVGIPWIRGEFKEKSAYGIHKCIVVDITGPHAEYFRLSAPGNTLPMHVVKKVISSALEPIRKLHDLGYMHGGMSFVTLFRLTHFKAHIPLSSCDAREPRILCLPREKRCGPLSEKQPHVHVRFERT